MPILITDEAVEKSIVDFTALQPTATSKTSMATAILRRALQDTPEALRQWLWDSYSPGGNDEERTNASESGSRPNGKAATR